MTFTRGQTQVLYQFLPGSVFEHDQYGFCRVAEVELREENVNQNALFNAITDLLWQWPNESSRPGFADLRHEPNRRNYVIGTPTTVRFKPYPTLLECRSCGRVFRLRDLMRRASLRPRQCPSCQNLLGQLRYVQAHNCGRLEELYYPSPACRTHGTAFLTFLDTGRVRSARWRCGACGNAEVGRLRMTPCTCSYSRSLPNQPSSQYERGLKTLTLSDSALFLPHIVPFINFDESREQDFYGDSEMLPLVLARTWGILEGRLPEIVRNRNQRRSREGQSAGDDGMTASLVRALEQTDPNNPLIEQWRRQQAQMANPPGSEAVQRVRNLLGVSTSSEQMHAPRQLVEHVAVLDTLRTVSIDGVSAWMHDLGDQNGEARLQQAATYADESLGIMNMQIISDFPIALCAAGYTRITRDPARSMLSPFETNDSQGRTPLYVIATETEGIYLQLSPIRVVLWLNENGFCECPEGMTSEEAWAWLYQNVPGLWQNRWQDNYHDLIAIAVRTLLHTMSHVLLKHVEWSGFSQNSVGEYLLPGALASVLYANRYAETKIGGLTTLFEQRLGIWLEDSAQSGRDCIYDPFCSDEGGTCVGCLHREYNCPQFNRELSRAVLYGGPTPESIAVTAVRLPMIRHGFWEFVRPRSLNRERATR